MATTSKTLRDIKDALGAIQYQAHWAANGGLNRADHKAGVGELKHEMRNLRDLASYALSINPAVQS